MIKTFRRWFGAKTQAAPALAEPAIADAPEAAGADSAKLGPYTGAFAAPFTVGGFVRAVEDFTNPEMAAAVRANCGLVGLSADTAELPAIVAGWVLAMTLPPQDASRDPFHTLGLGWVDLSTDTAPVRVRLSADEALSHSLIGRWVGGPTLPHYFAAAMSAGAVWATEGSDGPSGEVVELFDVGGHLGATVTLTFARRFGDKTQRLFAKMHFGAARIGPQPESEADQRSSPISGLAFLGAAARSHSDPVSGGEDADTYKLALAGWCAERRRGSGEAVH